MSGSPRRGSWDKTDVLDGWPLLNPHHYLTLSTDTPESQAQANPPPANPQAKKSSKSTSPSKSLKTTYGPNPKQTLYIVRPQVMVYKIQSKLRQASSPAITIRRVSRANCLPTPSKIFVTPVTPSIFAFPDRLQAQKWRPQENPTVCLGL